MMDTVSSQYGWHDEYVLALPYRRFKQIADVIAERQKTESVLRHSYAQRFYELLACFVQWEGKAPSLPDLFSERVGPRDSRFRTDRWWQQHANN